MLCFVTGKRHFTRTVSEAFQFERNCSPTNPGPDFAIKVDMLQTAAEHRLSNTKLKTDNADNHKKIFSGKVKGGWDGKFSLCLSAAQMSKRCPTKGAVGLNTLEGHVIPCYFLRRLIGVL